MSDRFHALPAAERTDPRHRRRHRRRTAAHARRGALRALIATHSALIAAAVVLLGIAGGGVAYAYWTAQATATAPPALRSGTLDLCVTTGDTPYAAGATVNAAVGIGTPFPLAISPPNRFYPGMTSAQVVVVKNCGNTALTLSPVEVWGDDLSTPAVNDGQWAGFTRQVSWTNLSTVGTAPWFDTFCAGGVAATAGADGRYDPAGAVGQPGATASAPPVLQPGEAVALCVQLAMNADAPQSLESSQYRFGITLTGVSIDPHPGD